MIKKFEVLMPELPASYEKRYVRKRGRYQLQEFRDEQGKKQARRPVFTGSFRHEGKWVDVGDIVESDRDLAAAFPARFAAVTVEGDE